MSLDWCKEAIEAARSDQRGATKNAHHEWFDRQVESAREKSKEEGHELQDPAKSIREAIGFWSGYFSQEDAELVHEFYGAGHPFFGTPSERAQLRPGEIWDMAMEVGRQKAFLELQGSDVVPKEPARTKMIVTPAEAKAAALSRKPS